MAFQLLVLVELNRRILPGQRLLRDRLHSLEKSDDSEPYPSRRFPRNAVLELTENTHACTYTCLFLYFMYGQTVDIPDVCTGFLLHAG